MPWFYFCILAYAPIQSIIDLRIDGNARRIMTFIRKSAQHLREVCFILVHTTHKLMQMRLQSMNADYQKHKLTLR